MAQEFKVYDKVWLMIDNRVCEKRVKTAMEVGVLAREGEGTHWRYGVFGLDKDLPGHQIFATKQELLESF